MLSGMMVFAPVLRDADNCHRTGRLVASFLLAARSRSGYGGTYTGNGSLVFTGQVCGKLGGTHAHSNDHGPARRAQ